MHWYLTDDGPGLWYERCSLTLTGFQKTGNLSAGSRQQVVNRNTGDRLAFESGVRKQLAWNLFTDECFANLFVSAPNGLTDPWFVHHSLVRFNGGMC